MATIALQQQLHKVYHLDCSKAGKTKIEENKKKIRKYFMES